MPGCVIQARAWNGGAKTESRTLTNPAGVRKLPAMAKKPATEASPVAHFEQSLDELELLVGKMEQGEMSLEDSLAAYERGVGLYRRCQAALEQAELRVRLLSDPARPDTAERFDPPGHDG
jgi:exodeoxyribonuclease VII small subunit